MRSKGADETIVIDANPIVSALLGGFSREVIFNHHFEFVTTAFTLEEVRKYISYIAQKVKAPEGLMYSLLSLLPLKVFPKETYQQTMELAGSLVQDRKDVDILALALSLNAPLWSMDKGFENIETVHIIKTKDFV